MPGGAATILGFMLEVAVNSSSIAGLSVDVYPRELQGIWFSDERDGRTQCRAFLTAYKNNDDSAFDLLVGSEMIRGGIWHSFAEYGEGNFYKLRRLSTTGAQSWRVEADVGIDSYPDEHSERASFQVKIENRKLIWIMKSKSDQSVPPVRSQRFFRCSAVPRAFERN